MGEKMWVAQWRGRGLDARPEQMYTSPNSTSLSAAASPVLAEKEMVWPTLLAGVEGSCWRHTPSAPAVEVYLVPAKVVCTVVAGGAKPHTVEGVSRWSTMWSPSVLEREKAVGGADEGTYRRDSTRGELELAKADGRRSRVSRAAMAA